MTSIVPHHSSYRALDKPQSEPQQSNTPTKSDTNGHQLSLSEDEDYNCNPEWHSAERILPSRPDSLNQRSQQPEYPWFVSSSSLSLRNEPNLVVKEGEIHTKNLMASMIRRLLKCHWKPFGCCVILLTNQPTNRHGTSLAEVILITDGGVWLSVIAQHFFNYFLFQYNGGTFWTYLTTQIRVPLNIYYFYSPA